MILAQVTWPATDSARKCVERWKFHAVRLILFADLSANILKVLGFSDSEPICTLLSVFCVLYIVSILAGDKAKVPKSETWPHQRLSGDLPDH